MQDRIAQDRIAKNRMQDRMLKDRIWLRVLGLKWDRMQDRMQDRLPNRILQDSRLLDRILN